MLQHCPCSPFPAGCQLPPEKDAVLVKLCTVNFNKLFVEPHTHLSCMGFSVLWGLPFT